MGLWLRLLAYATGAINRELLLKNEYLLAENKVLRSKIKGRLALTDEDRRTLATLGIELGRRLLAEVAGIVSPETIFRWYRDLVAKKFDGSKNRKSPGRPPTPDEVEKLVLEFARENPSWGYRRIVGALANVGHEISHQTVADILKRNDIEPAPTRKNGMSWSEFLKTHLPVLAATDFFTVEVLTLHGLVTYYVLFFVHLETRRVHLAGITEWPTERWMKTVAIQLTADYGFLKGMRYPRRQGIRRTLPHGTQPSGPGKCADRAARGGPRWRTSRPHRTPRSPGRSPQVLSPTRVVAAHPVGAYSWGSA